ncbi:MAG: YgcG family protein [Vicinamibacterales bacterium]
MSVDTGRRLRAVAAFVVLAVVGLAGQELPRPAGRVNDFATLLKPDQRQALETLLDGLERDTTAEVAVVTVRELGGVSVEDYANRLFNEWGIGQRGKDNGVLILVALRDREMRIEVGYGLEGVLPDGLAGAIIRENFTPHFRENRYAEGIAEGTARVVEIVRRNETLTAEQLAAIEAAAHEAGTSWGVAAMLSIFVGAGAFTFGTAAGARAITPLLSGLFFTGMALFFALMGAPRMGIVLLVLLAVGVATVGFVLGRRPSWRRSIRGTGRQAGGSGWVLGGGGGSGSSRSGGGGSSFGGGRSGGGGASGRW